ncbi:FAD-dependent pyridine nucleotide-disulfide oxidoreductase [Thermocrinis ruber]|uniref:FAD-dependent pyridine nucleotide-disulfide oxidoreductase n=1 Tax=Thermocrinis ruber TaxID=75906 RepID=W0DG81_9AQUI|nr:FAD-dependent oxidoreductase [Thermocrinis ruber]AHE95890.1 FAD-dependent pyridine nucleotide-disulfide oxidoreductase [Thermocrinis ruber]
MKQLAIIGGGPAGISASIYAARKKMDFVLITKEVGGQVIKAGNIENYLGYAMVDGIILVEKMMEHMRKLEVEPILDEVVDVERLSEGFEVRTASGQSFKTKTVLFCTGSEHRRLNVPGEKEYTGRGISYCYTCDAPFFKNKKVAVVGGGNSGFEAAEQLLNYASTIYLLEISDQFRADEVLREKVLGNEKVIPLLRHRVVSAEGDGMFLKAIVVEDLEKGKTYRLDVEGLFVEIGLEPNTKLAQKLGVLLNSRGEIIIDCNNRTSERGVYAAGDCTNIFAKQIITAAGDGAKALLSIYHDLTYGVSSWI